MHVDPDSSDEEEIATRAAKRFHLLMELVLEELLLDDQVPHLTACTVQAL